jgi:hypothetical protein
MFILNRLKNLHNRYNELGFPKILYFYLNNMFFGEQTNFNTGLLVKYLLTVNCFKRKKKQV